MTLLEELLRSERELANGDGALYRQRLTEDALVTMPGVRMTREECADAVSKGPGAWEKIDIRDAELREAASGVALVSYRFDAHRAGGQRYSALMTSVYVRRDDTWRMLAHQQTPLD